MAKHKYENKKPKGMNGGMMGKNMMPKVHMMTDKEMKAMKKDMPVHQKKGH